MASRKNNSAVAGKIEPKAEMKPFTVRMTLDRETKNTVRYQEQPEQGQPAKLETQYIQKFVFGGEPPTQIDVTVKAVK
jgi:hypothetical protein